ncbi:MAG: response regulator transcription factor [Bacteroidota bacterium]|jgi:two-component system, OmpR family, alkaline phosphatase synthesis response regulator PhoP
MENKDTIILLVDDEADILEFLGYNLAREGFQILKARNGQKAIDLAAIHKPHLVILDIMMPGLDGIETCNQLRLMPGMQNALIIFLTARGEDYSQIAGFEAGADDYITKPIKPKVLVSRIQALLRRFRSIPELSGKIVTSEFLVDQDRYLVVKDGREIILARKEFEILQLLVSRPNKVFTREEIFTRIWGEDVIVGDRTIDVHIRRIREKVGTDRIRTIKGVGYKYEEE